MLSSPGPDITFAPPVETARAAIQRLEAAGADVIVALTHDDLADDRDLARQIEAIDLILGGHDHDPMTFDDGGTLIVKAGHDAHYLAVVDLAVERVQRGEEETVEVVPRAWRYIRPPGSSPTRRSRRWSPATRRSWTKFALPVGTTTVMLDSRRSTVRTAESNFGNLITGCHAPGGRRRGGADERRRHPRRSHLPRPAPC